MNGQLVLSALAIAAAVVVWPWGPRPGRRGSAGDSPGPRVRNLRRILGGRADAPPLHRRVGWMTLGAAAVAVWAARWTDPLRWGVWCALPLLATAGVVALGLLEPVAARRRRLRLVLELPQALELLAAGLAAGRPLRSATEAVTEVMDGPLADDLAEVVAGVRLGRPEEEAWHGLRRHPVLGPVATDLARSAVSGTRLVEVLGVHARVARRLRHAELEATAKAVGVRCLTPLMVCFLPAFLLVGVVPIIGSVLAAAFR